MAKRRTSRLSKQTGLTGELPPFVRDAIADDSDEPSAVDAQETVDALVDLGVPDEEARAAVAERRVPLVLAQQVLGTTPRYSLERLAAKSGVDGDVLREIRLASGLPMPEQLSRLDLAWARHLAQLLEVISPEAVVRGARARGAAMATAVRSDLAVVRDELVLPMRRAGADDLGVSVALAETARSLHDISRELIEITYRLQLQHQLSTELAAIVTRADVEEVELAVGFVDVVGYTALSARVDPAGLDTVLDAFERRVVDVLSGHPAVSLVKYLGDAVMLVAPDVGSLAGALLELAAQDADEELLDAPLRGGLAFGGTLVREGDYFGQAVNTAARLTDIARPWSVLADEGLAGPLEEHYAVRRIRPTRIRGLGVRRPLSVRHPDDG